MAWDNILGEQKILPSTGGNSNEIKLENGKARKIRLILRENEQPYSYLEHTIEIQGSNGQTQFRTIRCAKTTNNPNANCPLCNGQQLKRRVRNASNVWDYETNQVQKLNAGDSIWKPIATTRKLGVNVLNVDWAVMKTGETRNDTEYTCTNLGQSSLTLPNDLTLFDIESDYRPHTLEEMQSIVESVGGNWNTLINPPSLEYPTLQGALEHVMPNGKYKDKKFAEIWETDKSSKGMIAFLGIKSDRMSPEKAAAQVILVNLGGMDIPGVPKNGQSATATVQTPATPTPTTAQIPVTPMSNNAEKIQRVNGLFSHSKFVTGGYTLIIDTMKKASNGKVNIQEFTTAELDSLIQLCESITK